MHEKEREKGMLGTSSSPFSSPVVRTTPLAKRKEKLKPDLKLKCGACGQVRCSVLDPRQFFSEPDPTSQVISDLGLK